MSDSVLLDHLKLIAVRAGALDEHVAGLLRMQYPNRDVETVLKAVGTAVVEIADAARKDAGRGLDSVNPARRASSLRRLRRHLKTLALIHRFLGYFQGADLALLPGMLVPVLNQRTRPFLPDSVLAVHGWEQHNFSFVSGAWLNSVFSEAGLVTRVAETFGVLAFPAAESRNILACSVLAHEAGHFVCESKGLVADLIDSLPVKAKAAIGKAARDYAMASGATPQEQLLELQRFLETVEAWLKELYADALGLSLLGPSALLALREQMLRFDFWKDEADSHPGWPMRARYALDGFLIAEDGWDDLFTNRIGEAWASLKVIAASKRPSGGDALLDAVYAVTTKYVGPRVLRKNIEKTLPGQPGFGLTAEECVPQLDAAVGLLQRGFVPGEVVTGPDDSEYVNPLTALLAGWVFKLAGMPEWDSPTAQELKDSADAMERVYGLDKALNDYVAKALEVYLVGTAWRGSTGDVEHPGD